MSVNRLSTSAARAAVTCTRNASLLLPRTPRSAAAAVAVNLSSSSRSNISRRPQLSSSKNVPAAVRFYSSEIPETKLYDFDAVKQLTESPSPERILIDVREPSEYTAGSIPTSLNIPIGSAPDALFMPAHEFLDKFGFEKPTADQEIVFYCKAGVRSRAAAGLARQVGYARVGEYRGSWLDWVNRGGVSGGE